MRIRMSTDADREWIFRERHEVYARELGQHLVNAEGLLRDSLDEDNVYVVAEVDGERAGFVSVTPPWAGRYGIQKYLELDDTEDLFEVRVLTVAERFRGSAAAGL